MKRGWTIVETLISLTILGIIAALCIPFFFPAHIPDHGVVVRKRFVAAHTTYMTTPVSAGKYHGTQLVPVFVPDKYGVVIQEDGTTDDGGRYYVDVCKARYDSLHAGDVWNRVEIEVEKSP